MIINQSYEVVELSTIKPHPNNPRHNNLDEIQSSIETNGFFGALVVNKNTNHILAGNHRYKAALAQGLTKVPVVFVAVDETTATKILLADNRTSDLGTYDDEVLVSILQELDDLQGTGYDQAGLDNLIQSINIDFDSALDGQELDVGEFNNFNHACPRCGFEYD